MTITLDGYRKLKETVDGLKREADRAQGRLDSLTDALLKEAKCDTVEKVARRLEKLREERQKAYEEYSQEMQRIVDEYGGEEWMTSLLPYLPVRSKPGAGTPGRR